MCNEILGLFLGRDHDLGAKRHLIEERNQIGALHSNATVTGWQANLLFMVRTVDVDESVARVSVVFLEAIEPEDAREDEIIGRRW